MARIPYKTDAELGPDPQAATVRTRRGGKLLNLDRILLHSPVFAQGWADLMTRVRLEHSLPPKYSELAICVVAILNNAEYEYYHHEPAFLKLGGSLEQVEALSSPETAATDEDLFDDVERAIIQLAVEMTRSVEVADEIMKDIQRLLASPRQVVDLVGTIAAYNMVSRFLVAFEIDPETK
jgi:alkylhydroperoxidase family enzyme